MVAARGTVSLRTASDVLGHATTSITADTDANIAQNSRIAALNVVAQALEPRADDNAYSDHSEPLPHRNCRTERKRPCHQNGDRASDLRFLLPRLDSNQQPSD